MKVVGNLVYKSGKIYVSLTEQRNATSVTLKINNLPLRFVCALSMLHLSLWNASNNLMFKITYTVFH
mgnify:CR=1 FL=1